MKTSKEDLIIKAVCTHFGIEKQALISLRDHNSSYIRYICFYLIRKHTFLSYYKISNLLQRSDCMSTVGYSKVEGLLEIKDRRILRDLNEINQLINIFTAEKKDFYHV